MKQELLLLHQKLDQVLSEISQLRDLLSSPQPSKTVSLQEAASFLHLSRSRLYALVYTGKIPARQHHKRGRLVFSQEALDNYQQSRRSI